MHSFDIMDVLGIVAVFAMPYMSGYIIRNIAGKKEIGQIETYLSGFLFLFLMQGLLISTSYIVLNRSFDEISTYVRGAYIAIAVVFVIVFILTHTLFITKDVPDRYSHKLKKEELIMIGITFAIFVLLCVRIIRITDYVREDHMLPMIRIMLNTRTIDVYNPITSTPYVYGVLSSRKIITLPIYYACICDIFGLNEIVLLYVVCTIQTVICTYMSCVLFIIPMIKIRERVFLYGIFVGVLMLSGDYFNKSIGARLLWNGYAGDTIVSVVMIPYVLYVILCAYRDKKVKLSYILKLLLTFISSVFMISLAKGALLIAITAGIACISCIIVGKKGQIYDDSTLIVEE